MQGIKHSPQRKLSIITTVVNWRCAAAHVERAVLQGGYMPTYSWS